MEVSFFTLIALLVVLAGVSQEILLLLLFRPFSERPSEEFPAVSVLVALRNEERNVERCLHALLDQDYTGEYEILAGDDNSSDHTGRLLAEIASKYPRVRVYSVTGTSGNARGKANVIEQLREHARGEVFLITDADTAVNSRWIATMSSGWQDKTGMVNGLTEVEGSSFQNMEWLHAQGMLHVAHRWKTLTAIGNNMGISRRAYESTGGFSTLPFTLTEDRALARAAAAKGFELESRLCAGTLSRTRHISEVAEFVNQRRRWMTGAVQLPFSIVFLLLVQALFYPAVCWLVFSFPVAGFALLVSKVIVQDAFIRRIHRHCSLPLNIPARILYEPYAGCMAWLHIIVYLLPGRISWKGRRFNQGRRER